MIITSAKKTFFAGGDLNDLRAADEASTPTRSPGSSARQGGLRRLETLGKSRSSRRSTARRSAAAWRSRSPAITGSSSMTQGSSSASRRSSSGCCRAPGGVTRTVRMLGIVNALMAAAAPGPAGAARSRALEIGIVDELVPDARGADPGRQEVDRGQPGRPAAVGRRREVQDPGRHPEHAARWRRTSRRSRPTCASRSRAPTTRRRITSWPPRSRARRSTSTTRSEIEGRYFVDLVTSQVAKNMIQAFFFDLQRATGDRGRPARDRDVHAAQDRRPRRRA